MSASFQPRYRSLDCWRGIACLIVVVYHAAKMITNWQEDATAYIYSVLRLGYLGVPIFFVISGYCIAATSDSHRRSNRSAWTFVVRRVRRIYPPFWILTLCMAVLFFAFNLAGSNIFQKHYDIQTHLSEIHWLTNLTLSDTWMRHIVGPEPLFNAASWSLCYEEQFYFICFMVLLFARERFFRVMLALTVFFTAVWLGIVAFYGRSHIVGTFIDFGWWQFACGVGVYWRLNYASDSARRMIDRVGLSAAAALIAALAPLALAFNEDSYFVNPWLGVIVAICFAVAIVWLRPIDEQIMNSRLGSMLARVGLFSYSLYLTHGVVCRLVYCLVQRTGYAWTASRALVFTIPLSVIASVLVAWVFYHLVEKHFLNSSVDKRCTTNQPEFRQPEMCVPELQESMNLNVGIAACNPA